MFTFNLVDHGIVLPSGYHLDARFCATNRESRGRFRSGFAACNRHHIALFLFEPKNRFGSAIDPGPWMVGCSFLVLGLLLNINGPRLLEGLDHETFACNDHFMEVPFALHRLGGLAQRLQYCFYKIPTKHA